MHLRHPFALILAIALLAPAAASAGNRQSYRLFGPAESVGLRDAAVYRADFVLPTSWTLRGTRHSSASALTFGPIGSCRSTVSIRGRTVIDDADQSSAQRAASVLDVPAAYVYGTSTRGGQASRVVRLPDTSSIRALMTVRSRMQQGAPAGKAFWTEILAFSTARRTCHTGGIRESIGFVLADAFAGGRVSGY